MLQKEVEHAPSTKTDAAAAFLASLEKPKLTSLSDAGKKPSIEILPPGMPSLSAMITPLKKPAAGSQSLQQPSKPLQLEAPPPATGTPTATPAPEGETQAPGSNMPPPENAPLGTEAKEVIEECSSKPKEANASVQSEVTEPVTDDNKPALAPSPESNSDQTSVGENAKTLEKSKSDNTMSPEAPQQKPDNKGTAGLPEMIFFNE